MVRIEVSAGTEYIIGAYTGTGGGTRVEETTGNGIRLFGAADTDGRITEGGGRSATTLLLELDILPGGKS